VDAVVVAAILMVLLGNLAKGQTASAEPFQLSLWLILGNAALFLVLCIGLLFYLRVVRGLNPAELFGLRQQGFWRALGLACVFIVPTMLVVNIFAANIMEWMKTFWPSGASQDLVEGFRSSTSMATKGLVIVTAVIIAPLVEETFFRGFIYGVIKRYTDSYFAALCSALLFATIHYHVGSLFPLAVLALGLCLAYEITGSLLVPMAMHALFNATSLAIMMFAGDAPA
jgi:membrane protease YdiL (CAAX protease family)